MSGPYATERQALDDVRDIDDAARRSKDRGTMRRLSTTFRPGASPLPVRRPASSGANATARRPQGSLVFEPQQAQAFAEIIRRAARAD